MNSGASSTKQNASPYEQRLNGKPRCFGLDQTDDFNTAQPIIPRSKTNPSEKEKTDPQLDRYKLSQLVQKSLSDILQMQKVVFNQAKTIEVLATQPSNHCFLQTMFQFFF